MPSHLSRKVMYTSLILVLTFFAVSEVFAQDLIERTQQGIDNSDESEEPNALARKVSSAISNARSHQEVSLFSMAPASRSSQRSGENSAVLLEIDQRALSQLAQNPQKSFAMTIPVDEKSALRINLIQNKLFADGFEVITSGPGDVGQNNLGTFYHGTVHGDPTSTVALSVFDDKVDIFIDDGQGYYRVSQEKSAEYLFYNARTTGSFGAWKCHNDHTHAGKGDIKIDHEKSLGRSAMMGCVPVYIEADFAVFQQEGANATPFITSLMNQTVALYTAIGITVEMSELFVYTTADPWAGLADLGDKLDAFGLAKGNAYNGRLAHLITAQQGGGVAWVDILCATQAGADPFGPFGVSGVTGTTNPSTDDVITLTHELGHNFGSDHTQACVWNGNNTAIDGCVLPEDGPNGTCARPTPNCPVGGGTIMSYCNVPDPPVNTCTVNTTWHPQVQTLITNNWNTATTNCLNTACGGGPLTGYTCADPFVINAAGSFNAPGPSQGNGAHDESIGATHANWYRFNAPTTGTITISSCGLPGGHAGTHNHVYHDWNNAWNADCAFADTNVGNVTYTEDRGCPADINDVTKGALLTGVPVTAGQPIYIEWDDAYSTQGFTWTIAYENAGPCQPSVTVNPPSVSGNVSASSTLTTGNPVTLSGNTVFSAPEVILSGVFTAPLGLTFEILMAGCMGGGGAAGTCVDPIIGACDGMTIQGDLNGGGSNIDGYDGNTGYGGPERVHSIPIPTNVNVTVSMQPEAKVDLDIFDMSDCAAGTTFGGSEDPGDGVVETFQIDNTGQPAFTLTLVVDGWQGDVGTYTLTVTCN